METLQACAQFEGVKAIIADAVKISTGGAPAFLVAEERTFIFGGSSVWVRLKARVFP